MIFYYIYSLAKSGLYEMKQHIQSTENIHCALHLRNLKNVIIHNHQTESSATVELGIVPDCRDCALRRRPTPALPKGEGEKNRY